MTRLTATGRPLRVLQGSKQPSSSVRGTLGNLAENTGRSGAAPRQRRRQTVHTSEHGHGTGWMALAVEYYHYGLPTLETERELMYKVGSCGYTADGFKAMAYQHAHRRLTGETLEVTRQED